MSGDLIWAMVRLVVALPLVLGLAYMVIKYGLARRYMAPAGKRRMKLVEQLSLGPKATLSLVELGGKFYLLAHQDNCISLVKEISELKEPEQKIIGDIVEFTPQTIEEFDRLQKPAVTDGKAQLTGLFNESRPRLNVLAGLPVRVKNIIAARRNQREREGEKS